MEISSTKFVRLGANLLKRASSVYPGIFHLPLLYSLKVKFPSELLFKWSNFPDEIQIVQLFEVPSQFWKQIVAGHMTQYTNTFHMKISIHKIVQKLQK